MPNENRQGLTHVGDAGDAHMVDVTEKEVTTREARAQGAVRMAASTLELIRTNLSKKGDVLGVARIAGIMAAKRTSELIPLCHGLPLTLIEIDFDLQDDPPCVSISSRARVAARTGVEMEALTAVAVAALTIYDMCKAVDRDMTIGDVEVVFKSGGRTGTYRRAEPNTT
jgi:cyclic pyranopterin phosphate synthase